MLTGILRNLLVILMAVCVLFSVPLFARTTETEELLRQGDAFCHAKGGIPYDDGIIASLAVREIR